MTGKCHTVFSADRSWVQGWSLEFLPYQDFGRDESAAIAHNGWRQHAMVLRTIHRQMASWTKPLSFPAWTLGDVLPLVRRCATNLPLGSHSKLWSGFHDETNINVRLSAVAIAISPPALLDRIQLPKIETKTDDESNKENVWQVIE